MKEQIRSLRMWAAIGLCAFVASTNGCEKTSTKEIHLAGEVRARGEVRVLALAHPLVYDTRKNSIQKGYDRELLRSFSKRYDLKIKWITKNKKADLIEALHRGEGDIAVGRFRSDEGEGLQITHGPILEESRWSVFCAKKLRIRSVKKITSRRIYLPKDARPAYGTHLGDLTSNNNIYVTDSTQRALRLAALQGCAVAEDLLGLHETTSNPKLEKVGELGSPISIVWMISSRSRALADLTSLWFRQASEETSVAKTKSRYHNRLLVLSLWDINRFHQRIGTILGSYIDDFKTSAEIYGLDWRLVAAVAYQESHWNPNARSYTGVRGLMQITRDTARQLGVADRNDPAQSIWGGSYYLKTLLEKFSHVSDPHERIALALAAYNSGLGNVLGAQRLARQNGRDAESWFDLRDLYPIARPDRGQETVDFVERVMAFYSVLMRVSTASLESSKPQI